MRIDKADCEAYFGSQIAGYPALKGNIVPRQIYVNLPVKDLKRSVDFFTRLGFSFDPRFTDENATCMIVADNIYVMLLTEQFFQTYTGKAVCDTAKSNEGLVALACDSREEVDELVRKALAAGGRAPRAPRDMDHMYGHDFEDLDGHIWGLFYMEPMHLSV